VVGASPPPALAIEHDAELVTFDSDFARFPGLVTVQL
jgi:predicted nucleic acid-binding protein